MATIINFPAMAAARDKGAERPGSAAKILFFTGVRYERVDVKELRMPANEPELPLAL